MPIVYASYQSGHQQQKLLQHSNLQQRCPMSKLSAVN
jgi:hypothetical protein